MKREAIIYRPSKSAMQSGIQNTKQWRMEIRSDDPKFVDPTMGWIGSRDTTRQLVLKFASEEEAVEYCKKHLISFDIRSPKVRIIKPKSYANNFSTGKRRYSDIVADRKIEL